MSDALEKNGEGIDRRSAIRFVVATLAALSIKEDRAEAVGPYCWAGKNGDEDIFIPCGVAQDTPKWIMLDLTGFTGLKVIYQGETKIISAQDVFTALSDISR